MRTNKENSMSTQIIEKHEQDFPSYNFINIIPKVSNEFEFINCAIFIHSYPMNVYIFEYTIYTEHLRNFIISDLKIGD